MYPTSSRITLTQLLSVTHTTQALLCESVARENQHNYKTAVKCITVQSVCSHRSNMWLTTHADCSIRHQPTRSTCHLSVSLTQCWSLLSCETLRDTSAHHCRNKKHTAQMNHSQTSGPSRVSDWSAALRWPEAEFLTVWRLQEMNDTCSSVKMTTQSARL